MSSDWCPENDGAWRSEQAEIEMLRKEALIQPYLDKLEGIHLELECVDCEEWCGKSPTKNDDGRCHVCKIKEILEDH